MGLFMPLISSKEDQDGNSATVNLSVVLKTNLMTAIENDVFKCIYKCFPSNYFSFLIAFFSSFHTFDIANKLLIPHTGFNYQCCLEKCLEKCCGLVAMVSSLPSRKFLSS